MCQPEKESCLPPFNSVLCFIYQLRGKFCIKGSNTDKLATQDGVRLLLAAFLYKAFERV